MFIYSKSILRLQFVNFIWSGFIFIKNMLDPNHNNE